MRSTFGWTLAVMMLVVFCGYILLIAFDKELLGKKIGSGVMTWGIPIGLFVIVFTVVLTGIYVQRANKVFDNFNGRDSERGAVMSKIKRALGVLALLTTAGTALGAGSEFGQAVKQPTNWTAITIFALFVVFTLFITKWAAAKNFDRRVAHRERPYAATGKLRSTDPTAPHALRRIDRRSWHHPRDAGGPATNRNSAAAAFGKELQRVTHSIDDAADATGLQRAASEIQALVQGVVEQARAEPLTRLISALNDRLTRRLIDAALPFGGYKQSGWGREMGREVFELYTRVKSVCIKI